jgi:hypothetical protein
VATVSCSTPFENARSKPPLSPAFDHTPVLWAY